MRFLEQFNDIVGMVQHKGLRRAGFTHGSELYFPVMTGNKMLKVHD